MLCILPKHFEPWWCYVIFSHRDWFACVLCFPYWKYLYSFVLDFVNISRFSGLLWWQIAKHGESQYIKLHATALCIKIVFWSGSHNHTIIQIMLRRDTQILWWFKIAFLVGNNWFLLKANLQIECTDKG